MILFYYINKCFFVENKICKKKKIILFKNFSLNYEKLLMLSDFARVKVYIFFTYM